MDSSREAMEAMVKDFLDHTREEEPRLAGQLEQLDERDRIGLAGVLGRFSWEGKGHLTAQERLFARRVLIRLRKPSADVLAELNRVLDYLDINFNSLLEPQELDLAMNILEIFSSAESANETLSLRELQMLYAVLRHLDRNNNQRLDADELRRLHQALADPKAFLERQRTENPLMKDLF